MIPKRVRGFFLHSKTVFAARMYTLAGGLVVSYDTFNKMFGSQDFTPLTTRMLDAAHIPSDFRGLVLGMFASATGELFVWLRKITGKPLDQKAREADQQ